jgi:hypothetical protein
MSGPHLSYAACRAGPTWQCAVASWPPRATPTPWFKAAVGTARRTSRQPTSPAPPVSRPPRARRRHPESSPCPHRRLPDSSPRPRHPPPDRSPRSRRRPDHRGPKPPTPGSIAASRRSPLAHRRHAAPLSHRSPQSPVRRRRAAVGSPSSAAAEPRRRRALVPHTLRRPRSWAAHAGRARTVHLGRAWFRPSGTRLNFIIF